MLSERDKKFLEKVRSKAGEAIHRYGLIAENDRILVGLSGGKDSLALLDILSFRRRHLPVHFDLHAAHIRMKGIPYESDIDYLSDFCSSRDVTFHLREGEVDLSRKPKKQPCFICSRTRRKEMFYLAGELGCSKVALGHHMDDILETLLLNMIFHGAFSTMPPKLYMFKGKFEIIRPFALITGKELERYARIQEYHLQLTKCPHEGNSIKVQIRQMISDMTRVNRLAKINLYRSMTNIEMGYLPGKSEEWEKET
jgi:tRNA(Ile)-lysidine synthase TilS/MesJ